MVFSLFFILFVNYGFTFNENFNEQKMKQIFDTPPKSTQDRFKNKSKKVLVDEIIKMMQSNQDKIKKNDLIRLHQILNITLN